MDFDGVCNEVPIDSWFMNLKDNKSLNDGKGSGFSLDTQVEQTNDEYINNAFSSSNGREFLGSLNIIDHTSVSDSQVSSSPEDGKPNGGLTILNTKLGMELGEQDMITLQEQSISSSGTGKGKSSGGRKKTISEEDAFLLAKDDSELTEEEIQRKRKAQNRAAQRAFRERKENQFKMLQNRLAQSEEEKQRLLAELSILKEKNSSMLSENQLLKDRSHNVPSSISDAYEPTFFFPLTRNDFIHGLLRDQKHEISSDNITKIYDNPDCPGNKVLVVGAVWDYLQAKMQIPEYANLDTIKVMDKLRGNEKCHGYGPAYSLSLVEQAIQEVISDSGGGLS